MVGGGSNHFKKDGECVYVISNSSSSLSEDKSMLFPDTKWNLYAQILPTLSHTYSLCIRTNTSNICPPNPKFVYVQILSNTPVTVSLFLSYNLTLLEGGSGQNVHFQSSTEGRGIKDILTSPSFFDFHSPSMYQFPYLIEFCPNQ